MKARDNIKAVSVLGLIWTCLAFKKSGESAIRGLIFTNLTPLSKHFFIPNSVVCFPTPPAETLEFFKGIPPNINTNSQSSDKAFQVVWSSNVE